MRVAVSAASGQLGSAIISQALVTPGIDSVLGIARSPEKILIPGIETLIGDYNNRLDFESALQGIDTLLLVSGMSPPEERIQQHRNVIDAAKSSGVSKIVYTSIFGNECQCLFDAIIRSNRQTEADIMASGLEWSIGRNGLYIEADLEYINQYIRKGEIANSAGSGRCGYTTRKELAFAYCNMILDEKCNGQIYNLHADPISQDDLVAEINEIFGTGLVYNELTIEEYIEDRTKEHGEFLGKVIAGIYQGIRNGAFDLQSDYLKAAGRPHRSLREIINTYNK